MKRGLVCFGVRTWTTRFAVGALALSGLALAVAPAGNIAETSRFSIHPVPHVTAAPQIDGVVGKREWDGATLLPNLIHSQRGLAGESRARVFVCHDDTALYIAFQIERPEKVRAPGETDEVEVVLDAGHAHKTSVTFRANVASQKEIKARFTQDFGWEGEMAVPFVSLGRKTPAAGEVWGFNLVNRQRTPVEETSAYSFGSELSHLVFARDVPPLRFLQVGTFSGEAGSGAALEILNASSQPASLNVALELLRRKPDAKGSYLPNVAGAVSEAPDIIIPPTEPVSVAEELAKYDPVATATTNVALALPANRRAEIRVTEYQPAEYLLKYRVARGDQTLSAGVLPYRLTPPMRMTLRPYFLAPGIVEAKVDLRKAKDWVAGATAKFALVRKAGHAPLATIEHPFAEAREFAVALPIDKAGPGGYLVTLDLIGPDGKSRGTISEGFQKPPTPDWMTKRAGLAPVIPPPWKPIRANAREVSFLMGDYRYGDSILPSQVNVRSVYEEKRAPLLTAPMALKGKVNGKEIVWAKSKNGITSKTPELVKLEGATAFENLSVTATTEFEYDGMAKVTLKIAPAGVAAAVPGGENRGPRPSTDATTPLIDSLALEIPIAKEFASLCLHGPVASDFWMKKGLVPGNHASGAVPAEGIRGELTASFWLGNEERGFTWFAENSRGWHLATNYVNQAIEIVPGDTTTVLRLNLFKDDQPFMLEKEREIVFAFLFTPSRTPRVKPVNHGLVHDRMEQTTGTRMTDGEAWIFPLQGWPVIPDEELFELSRRQQSGERIFTCEWRAATLEEMRAAVEGGHKVGVAVTPYLAWGIASRSKAHKVYGDEMITDPLTGIGCDANSPCWNTPVQDVIPALLRDRILDLNIDGFRTDAGWYASPCENPHHAGYGSECGWVDDTGKLRSSRNLFAARRMAQRAYRLFHGGVRKDGFCLKHIYNGTRYDAILGHTDSVMSAEGAEMKASSLKEFPLAFYRAGVLGDPHGWQVSYMAKAERVGYDARLGICLIHNLNPRGGHEIMKGLTGSYSRSASHGTPTPVWAAREWIGPYEKGMELWGYWKNAKYLETGSPDMKGTIYVRRGQKLLLGLLNLDRKPVEAAVRLDLKALGFAGKVYAHDPMLREEVAIHGDTLKLAFTPEGMRMIQIASKPFDIFVPEKVGTNLIAELVTGVPEGWRAVQYVDEKKVLSPTPDDLRIENGVVVMHGKGDNVVGLSKSLANTEKGKCYLLEAEVHVDAGDGAFLGEMVDASFFWISCGETSSYNHDFRVFGSQMAPGHVENVRLYFVPTGHLTVDFRMNRSKGKATIKNIGLYKLNSAPAWAKQGTPQ